MTTEKMNIHKALCELKILDDRIPKVIRDCEFVTTKKSASKMVGSQSVEEFKKSACASYNQVVDLIRRREAIKRAVVLSNATTKVMVGGVEYTVAEAIELKNHGLDGKKLLRHALSSQIELAESRIEIANQDAERKADVHVQGIAGGKDMKADEVKALRDGYLAGMVVEMVDPLPDGAEKLLKKLDDEINAFLVDVDSALSTSNALTEITVEY